MYECRAFLCAVLCFAVPIQGFNLFQGVFQKPNCFQGKDNSACCPKGTLWSNFEPEWDQDCVDDPETYMFLFTPSSPDKPELIHDCGGQLPTDTSFNPNHQTVIVVHGWTDGVCWSSWMREYKDELLRRAPHNVILIDWTWGSSSDSNLVLDNADIVAQQIAFVVKNLIELNGLDLDLLQLIGPNYGAHLAGMAGRYIDVDHGLGKVGRITGLDPGFPDESPEKRLDPTDAKFVDVTHTRGGFCPLISSDEDKKYDIGHAEYYVNGGETFSQISRLPNIIQTVYYGLMSFTPWTCATLQSIQYYKNTIVPDANPMVAVECKDSEDFSDGSCRSCGKNGKRCVLFGYDAPLTFKYTSKMPRKFYLEASLVPCPDSINDGIDLDGFPIQKYIDYGQYPKPSTDDDERGDSDKDKDSNTEDSRNDNSSGRDDDSSIDGGSNNGQDKNSDNDADYSFNTGTDEDSTRGGSDDKGSNEDSDDDDSEDTETDEDEGEGSGGFLSIIGKIIGGVAKTVGNVVKTADDIGGDVVDGVIGTVGKVVKGVDDVVDDAISDVDDVIGDVAGTVGGAVSTVDDVIGGAVKAVDNVIGDILGLDEDEGGSDESEDESDTGSSGRKSNRDIEGEERKTPDEDEDEESKTTDDDENDDEESNTTDDDEDEKSKITDDDEDEENETTEEDENGGGGFLSIIGKIVGGVVKTVGKTAKAVDDAASDVVGGVADAVGGVAKTVGGVAKTVDDAASDVVGGVVDTAGGVLDSVDNVIGDFVGGVLGVGKKQKDDDEEDDSGNDDSGSNWEIKGSTGSGGGESWSNDVTSSGMLEDEGGAEGEDDDGSAENPEDDEKESETQGGGGGFLSWLFG